MQLQETVRDAIAALQVLYERNLEYNNKVFVCYVDLKMMEIL